MAKIIIPTPLRKFTDNVAAFDVQGATVGESIDELVAAFPGLKEHLKDQNDKLRSFVNIFVGDEDIRSLNHEKTPVSEHAVISIVPAIAGGIFN
jgi:molybdopterin converting factor small subunit